MRTVAVLGAGNMGTALAHTIAGNGHPVRVWSIETDVLEEVRDRRLNTKYLPAIPLHPAIEAFWEIPETLTGAQLAIVSVPSQVVRTLARQAAPHLGAGQTILNVAKGLEAKTHLSMSQVLAQELPPEVQEGIATMGGPAIAGELAAGVPTAVIVAARRAEAAAFAQETMQNSHLRVETTTDVVGVELGATLKNIYAIALGMCDGLGYGTNTKSFFVSAALAEMALISEAFGARPETTYGLAGLGDLITTGFNPHSRNRTLGERLVTQPDWRQFLETHTVEGVEATAAIRELTADLALKMPLLEMLSTILFRGAAPEGVLRAYLGDFATG